MPVSAWEPVLRSALEFCQLWQDTEEAKASHRHRSWQAAARAEKRPYLPSLLSITAKHSMSVSGLNLQKAVSYSAGG